MAKKEESKFWHKIRPSLLALPNTWFERITQVSTRGTPDVIMCINGWFVALELKKSEKEKPDPLQEFKLGKIREANGFAFVCHPKNWETLLEFLTELSRSP